jgi:alpha-ketoglutarate-dependent taurine dioxygenase
MTHSPEVELRIEPITPVLGARLYLAVKSPGMTEAILDALNAYGVIVFPEIHMSDDQFVAMTESLGDRHDLGVTQDSSDASNNGIYRIALDKDDKTQLDYIKGNDYWHMDGTVYDAPGKATLLKCERAPSEPVCRL